MKQDKNLIGDDKIVSGFTAEIAQIFNMVKNNGTVSGMILNPWHNPIKIDKNIISIL